jgi:hypothetical protein
MEQKIQRYYIREYIKDDKIVGIEYHFSEDGNWVLFNDVKNIIEDKNLILSKVNDIIDIIIGKHRII